MPISTWGNDPTLITLAGVDVVGVGGFSNFAIPEYVKSGGPESLVIHKQPGGARQIDVLGNDDEPYEWSGVFLEADAEAQLVYFQQLKVAGNPIPLTYGPITDQVVISDLTFSYMAPHRIEYHIKCVPVLNGSNAAAGGNPAAAAAAALPAAGGILA
jgi:hypothetical protein